MQSRSTSRKPRRGDDDVFITFEFPAKNNKAEYEAVITGLWLAKHLKAERLKLHSDSQVVVNQIKGEYEV